MKKKTNYALIYEVLINNFFPFLCLFLKENIDEAIAEDHENEIFESSLRKYGRISSKRNAIMMQRISSNDEKIQTIKFNTIAEPKEKIPELIYNFSQCLLMNTNLVKLDLFMVTFNAESFEMLLNALGKIPRNVC